MSAWGRGSDVSLSAVFRVAGIGGGGDGENRWRWLGEGPGRGCTCCGRPVRRRRAAPLPRPCPNSGDPIASFLATEQREKWRVRVVVNGEAKAMQKREKGGVTMARPWSTLARSPLMGAGAPDHGNGYGEARASLEVLWGACSERGGCVGEVWWQGGVGVPFYRRTAGSPWAGCTGDLGDERPCHWGNWAVRQRLRAPLGLRRAL